MALQGAGLSSQAAGVVDCGLGFAGMGAGAWIEANRAVTASMRVSEAARYGSMPEYFSVSRPTEGATLASSGKLELFEGKNFRSFTEDNFRHNLKVLTETSPPSSVHAHHVFPKTYTTEFAKLGINVNDPLFGTWWGKGHLNKAKEYNDIWLDFLLERNRSVQETLDFGKSLMQKNYGFPVNFE